jgi:hypothetical protein
MRHSTTLLPTAALATAALLLLPASAVLGDGDSKQPPLPSMQCVDVTGTATLMPDLECNIAKSHHRYDQFPESIFFYDLMPEVCEDPANPQPCCVMGKFEGMMGGYPFIAKAICGFTVNALSDPLTNEAAVDLMGIEYQQFTARTLLMVYYGTETIPEPKSEKDKNKPSFGLFFADSGVARADFYVSQRLSLTGAKKLPRGTKMKLDMWGAPPVRQIEGTICGPKLADLLERVATKRKGGDGHDDDDNGDDDDDGDDEEES